MNHIQDSLKEEVVSKGSFFKFQSDGLTFESQEAAQYRMIYAPLCGPDSKTLKSAITPILSGDIKVDKSSYVTKPSSREDLRYPARNFYLQIKGGSLMSLADHRSGDSKVCIGPLWHQLIREYKEEGLKAEVLNFIPANGDNVELMHVRVGNLSSKTVTFTPTAAVPVFARSLANKHDHEHVTALLNRTEQTPEGLVVTPTMRFNEEGHKVGRNVYFVYGATSSGEKPAGTFPTLESFYGESGDIYEPEALVKEHKPEILSEKAREGKEVAGALQFHDKTLKPGEVADYVIMVGVAETKTASLEIFSRYNSFVEIENVFKEMQTFWAQKATSITFKAGDPDFNGWMHWVTIQPVLRRIFGCSFLPDHDYGKGGKGWRDLWQDLLSLILIEPEMVRENLINNVAGIRIDGSNATIIGSKPGEFIADRNAITRVWMDHGAWPLMTMLLYVHQTGDYGILLEENTYFRDPQMSRTYKKDATWTHDYGHHLKDGDGCVYKGTVIEHLLLQNLVQFFNVGEHNITRLESADWNDGLDMAFARGESVAFMSFYAGNLAILADALEDMSQKLNLKNLKVFKELTILLDSLGASFDYDSIDYKKKLLFEKYCSSVQPEISGKSEHVAICDLVKDLRAKSAWMIKFIRSRERVEVKDPVDGKAYHWFNGYYDNKGERVEGLKKDHVRMTLTGEVFAVMQNIADERDIQDVVRSVNRYLKDPELGGIRLNSDFHVPHYLDLGRAFGFAFGTKENGAFFSHMNVMYAYALYKRGFVREGYDVLNSIYKMCMDTRRSKIYPGIPEYFDSEGRGMYHYLTGSASWLVLTQLTQVFGVRGEGGDLILAPKLVKEEFDANGQASVECHFAGKRIEVVYLNSNRLDFGSYRIISATLNNKDLDIRQSSFVKIEISRDLVSGEKGLCRFRVNLG